MLSDKTGLGNAKFMVEGHNICQWHTCFVNLVFSAWFFKRTSPKLKHRVNYFMKHS